MASSIAVCACALPNGEASTLIGPSSPSEVMPMFEETAGCPTTPCTPVAPGVAPGADGAAGADGADGADGAAAGAATVEASGEVGSAILACASAVATAASNSACVIAGLFGTAGVVVGVAGANAGVNELGL